MTPDGSHTRPEAPGYWTNTPKSASGRVAPRARVELDELDADGGGAGVQQRLRLRQSIGVHGEHVRRRLRGAARDQHPLDDRRGLVEHRRVRRRQAGQVGDHRLEVDERLEPALRDLGLVGRVGGVPGRVLEHVPGDDRRRERVVVAEADHRPRDAVLRGELAQLGERLRLGRGGRDVGGLARVRLDGCRHRGLHERVDRVVAERVEHERLGCGIRSDVTARRSRVASDAVEPPLTPRRP